MTWVDTMRPLLVPGVDCYQVVFTIPDDLSSLALGNRREMFRLLFRSAWESLRTIIEEEQQFEAAAAMVLHTWNQHLESHVHVHAVVPGGGPSLKHPDQWKRAVPPPHERPDRWWLVDANELRREFRTRFLAGLRRLHAAGNLKLEGTWSRLRDADHFETFLAPLEAKSWVTYIEPPPKGSRPEDVIRYLARYLTGGPISDRRLVSDDGTEATFTARTGTTRGGSEETEQVTLSGAEFVRRWCLHVLPSGFTKSRRFGGWSSPHRKRFLAACERFAGPQDSSGQTPVPVAADTAHDVEHTPETLDRPGRPCPMCGEELERLDLVYRTSWRDIFSSDDRPAWYQPRSHRTWESGG